MFDKNEIKIDDLFRLNLSGDAPSDIENSFDNSKYDSPGQNYQRDPNQAHLNISIQREELYNTTTKEYHDNDTNHK